MKIPIGKVITYRQLAEKIGNPKAVRAVANACGKNKIAVIIPCHRVIRSDGTLGGYSSGIWRKRILLQREGFKFWLKFPLDTKNLELLKCKDGL